MCATRIGWWAAAALTALACALPGPTVGGAVAQESAAGPVKPVPGPVQIIRLSVGKGGLFRTASPYAKISVADEKVVEVTPQSDLEFIINPKSVGVTNVYLLDDKNAMIAGLDIEVVGRAAKLRQTGGGVRIYGRIYDNDGRLLKPSRYRCDASNCDSALDLSDEESTAEAGTKSPPQSNAIAPAGNAVSPVENAPPGNAQ